LESSGSELYNIVSDTLIALGDVRLGCNCLAMEIQSMMLSMHSCCANMKATQSLEVFSY
ncbi:unnamed protein product, partial [Staurois parvus]